MARITLCLAIVALCASPAAAQTGRVSGAITDETGAVLPAVDVRAVLKDAGGETMRSVVTNAKGAFELGALTPGAWVLTASLPGFETGTFRATIQIGDSLDWSPRLQLGSIQETIVITTAPPQGPLRVESPRPIETAAAPRPVAAPTGVIRVGGSVKPPRKVVNVVPLYPPDVAAQGVGGVVILNAIIGTDGFVRDIKTLRSPNSALELAASSAFNGWQFTPTLLNGVPVDTRITAIFNFEQN